MKRARGKPPLSLIANLLAGRSPEQYQNLHDKSNEAGGPEHQSRTNFPKVYKFTSNNGIEIKILDTPGIADTRGLEQDDLHKANIAKTMGESIASIDGILILVNGTIPRLGVATDYALSTLLSILPRTFADNIGILFTNVADPLSLNCGLPEILQGTGARNNQWLIDNPIVLWKKHSQESGTNESRTRAKWRRSMSEAHENAVDVIADILNWLDGLAVQPTNDAMELTEQLQRTNHEIGLALSCTARISKENKRLEEAKQSAYSSTLARLV